ncbi:transposase [Cohaesibacter sp. ES.047]|uniref:IS66 family insertion sequence element accessory protein TnpB n=1 Tax=Cohaesibacter sp. ES.047 TaxID=1798205 RepID=UPI000BB6A4F6|nr:IS66 family insertion sequence element accessory protein TnpB [Cohaesibacter sp. ES.047]SNY91017.1 transposase [Cohaesibacter sp. ES.047]
MIFPSNRVKILVASKPVDFRKGHDGLAALVRNELNKDPFTGTVFVFRSRRADRLKLLYWDGTGLVLAYKRLEEQSFVWPEIRDGLMRLDHAQFEALFAGLDWRRVRSLEVRAPQDVE